MASPARSQSVRARVHTALPRSASSCPATAQSPQPARPGSVRWWNGTSSKQQWKLDAGNWIPAIAISPDGRFVAGSALDDSVRVLDSQTGREIYRLAGHGDTGGQRTLRFSRDSRSLISWGDDFYLRIWDMKTGKARREHAIRPKGVEIPQDDEVHRMREDIGLDGEGIFTPDCKLMGANQHWRQTITCLTSLQATRRPCIQVRVETGATWQSHPTANICLLAVPVARQWVNIRFPWWI